MGTDQTERRETVGREFELVMRQAKYAKSGNEIAANLIGRFEPLISSHRTEIAELLSHKIGSGPVNSSLTALEAAVGLRLTEALPAAVQLRRRVLAIGDRDLSQLVQGHIQRLESEPSGG